MKGIIKDNKYLIFLWLFCILGLLFFCGHYQGILIDFGREVYYPQRILQGKILYKDLFNIYGPLAYQINAVLYKFFGAKLSTLYGAGVLCSLLTVSGIFLIAKKFLSEFLSFGIGLFSLAVGVTTSVIFNFHFPYSWAVLYGLVAFLFSLYFLLNFCDDKNSTNLCISSFLAGICITCKYDFILYGIIVLFLIIKEKNFKALLSFLSVPFISFGILFIQGLRLSDLANFLIVIKAMAKSKTLTYFYQNSGIYFHPKALVTDFLLFLKFVIPFSAILASVYLFNRNKIGSISLQIFGWVTFLWFFTEKYQIAFGFLPLVLLIFALFSFKKFDFKLFILVLSALAAGAKVFWVLILQSYGNYYVPIILIAFLALLFTYLPKKLEKVVAIYVIIAGLFIFISNFSTLSLPQYKITTERGTIYTQKSIAGSTNQLINFLKNQNGNAVIFPEGMSVNFLSNTISDDYYNSLLPLYVETFTEEKIINHYRENLPEYVIFNNLNMKDYYFKYICEDYALDFCRFVKDNYEMDKIIDNGFRYVIFKRK